MKKVNALELRQSLGKVLAQLERNGEPIVVEKGRKPVAALISLKDYHERFAEKAAREERDKLFEEMDKLRMRSVDPTPGGTILRELRYGE